MAKKRAKKPAKKKAKAKAKPKAKKVSPIPKGFHTITPYLGFKDSAFAIMFYQKAFGAKEMYRLVGPDGKVGHAELRIGDSYFMMSDEYPEMGSVSAETMGGSPIKLYLSVKNVDAFVAKAIANGATVVRPVENQFYGMRSGMIADPFGYAWSVGTQIEVVTPKQMAKRMERMMSAAKS
jgi:PhnB protein